MTLKTDPLNDFTLRVRALHGDIPARERVAKAFDEMGLSREWAAMREGGGEAFDLAERALMERAPGKTRARSPRTQYDEGNRAASHLHQGEFDLFGVPTEALVRKLTRLEYVVGDQTYTCDDLLRDELAARAVHGVLSIELQACEEKRRELNWDVQHLAELIARMGAQRQAAE